MVDNTERVEKWNRTWIIGQYVKYCGSIYKTRSKAYLSPFPGGPLAKIDLESRDGNGIMLHEIIPVSLNITESNYSHKSTKVDEAIRIYNRFWRSYRGEIPDSELEIMFEKIMEL